MELTEIFYIISIISGLAIILLLAIQSWVLVKLLPEIKRTAKNSTYFTETLHHASDKFGLNIDIYPKALLDVGIKNCKNYKDKKHIHNHLCF